MILGFKKQFQNGEPTYFKEKILKLPHPFYENVLFVPKIHTLRETFRIKPGMDLHLAYGVRTKNYEQFALKKCTSTQLVEMFLESDNKLFVFIEDRCITDDEIKKLVQNDGLCLRSFINWFFPKGNTYWRGQIIHWTDFKY